MTTILLAVDVGPGRPLSQLSRAVEMASKLARGDGDRVFVLHVREFSLARLARKMRDQGGASGCDAVRQIVADMRAAGIQACGLVREADTGHVAQTIYAVAAEVTATLIVLGAREQTDLPRTPFDMATHLLHISTLPVLIVPPGRAESWARPPSAAAPLPTGLASGAGTVVEVGGEGGVAASPDLPAQRRVG